MIIQGFRYIFEFLFNDTSTLVDHFVLSLGEREKLVRRTSAREKSEGRGKRQMAV